MTDQESKNLRLLQRAKEGESIDSVTEPLPEGFIELMQQSSELQNGFLEMFADVSFYKAAKVLVELLDSSEDEVRVRAASKLVDLRKDVYKVQKTQKTSKPIMDKLFEDGFS